MRRPVLLFLILNLAIVGFLIHSVWTLLSLLVVDGSEDAISRAELPAPGSDLIDGRPQLIPKIIHQTYINESIPEVWQEPQKSCIELHKDWEYKLWTDALSREFIATEYPWFLETFDNYEYPIQRADSIRYFVLAHFGGVYIDMDDEEADNCQVENEEQKHRATHDCGRGSRSTATKQGETTSFCCLVLVLVFVGAAPFRWLTPDWQGQAVRVSASSQDVVR